MVHYALKLEESLKHVYAHREETSDEAAVLHFTYNRFDDLKSRRDRCDCAPTEEDAKRCFILPFDRMARHCFFFSSLFGGLLLPVSASLDRHAICLIPPFDRMVRLLSLPCFSTCSMKFEARSVMWRLGCCLLHSSQASQHACLCWRRHFWQRH